MFSVLTWIGGYNDLSRARVIDFSSGPVAYENLNFKDRIYAAKFEQTIIHQDVHLRRESRSHVHVLLRF